MNLFFGRLTPTRDATLNPAHPPPQSTLPRSTTNPRPKKKIDLSLPNIRLSTALHHNYRHCLDFPTIDYNLKEGECLKLGRFAGEPEDLFITFRSKVVSRNHAEIKYSNQNV